MNYNILIGGEAGQGLQTFTNIFSKVMHKRGYYIFTLADYMSRVRGGHNFFQLRFADDKLISHSDKLDVIIALNQDTLDLHVARLSDNGFIIADDNVTSNDKRLISVPAREIAKEVGNIRTMSTVLLGTLLKLFGLDDTFLKEIYSEAFNEKITQMNLEAFAKGQTLADKNFTLNQGEVERKMLINGNQAIALGALAANMKFYSAYPMTPATSIMSYLTAQVNDCEIIVEQAEDEIAAINMAIGAAAAGARAMTGTSGGGFSLMTEGLGLAGIAEVPLVIALIQRPGPATGLPTRTEQADLKFAVNASQCEFGRIVIAPNNPEDAFYQTVRAFNLADKYQLPVIILGDQYLADATQTCPVFDLNKVKINRYLETNPDSSYQRYSLTESGISPRVIPGKYANIEVNYDSDEHDCDGNITESSDVRNNMVLKRERKFNLAKKDMLEPKLLGAENAEVLLIGWGSTYSQLDEAIQILASKQKSVSALVFSDIWPLPTKLLTKLAESAKTLINVEQNATSQIAGIIREVTGIKMDHSLLRYDGRPLSAEQIVSKVLEV